ncbi:metalloregulator ArsR/SmtB family transcription factor [Microbacterium marinilacus]|uniref:Metalloregulator ArsR/SmtB family transcription factor n=2 Tax=Microbacterium marinilacus TaxID=415209 RepID=A0ABP7BK11_9MICO
MTDATRARILLELLSGPAYPARLAEILALSRPNVSNHLACLRGCGIVVATTEGRRTRYELADAHLARAITVLVDAVIAFDDGAHCTGSGCAMPDCCTPTSAAPSCVVIGNERTEIA